MTIKSEDVHWVIEDVRENMYANLDPLDHPSYHPSVWVWATMVRSAADKAFEAFRGGDWQDTIDALGDVIAVCLLQPLPGTEASGEPFDFELRLDTAVRADLSRGGLRDFMNKLSGALQNLSDQMTAHLWPADGEVFTEDNPSILRVAAGWSAEIISAAACACAALYDEEPER